MWILMTIPLWELHVSAILSRHQSPRASSYCMFLGFLNTVRRGMGFPQCTKQMHKYLTLLGTVAQLGFTTFQKFLNFASFRWWHHKWTVYTSLAEGPWSLGLIIWYMTCICSFCTVITSFSTCELSTQWYIIGPWKPYNTGKRNIKNWWDGWLRCKALPY